MLIGALKLNLIYHSPGTSIKEEWETSAHATMSTDNNNEHIRFMKIALEEARKSPPKPTNFCVGACLVAADDEDMPKDLLVTGYTLECEGNTHAEQCCFIKFAQQHGCSEEDLCQYLPSNTLLYTTMEPCNKRSVGNLPCVDRILRLKDEGGRPAIRKVFVGVAEPETFVGINEGQKRLKDAGIEIVHVPGFEAEILEVATAGHDQDQDSKEGSKVNVLSENFL